MKAQLMKFMLRNQLVDMIYLAKSGEVTKRRIKIIHVNEQSIIAYCFMKQSQRTFLIDNILSLYPVFR
ncbi:MAG TPA: transcriptional regulator [Ureibacillus sp.]|nr:transcriptional regulator [Ureibacillus sp.]